MRRRASRVERGHHLAVGQRQQLARHRARRGRARGSGARSRPARAGARRAPASRSAALRSRLLVAVGDGRGDVGPDAVEAGEAREADQLAQQQHERGKRGDQQQRQRGPAEPVLAHQRGRDEAREPGAEPQQRRAGQRRDEQRAPAQAALPEIGERRPRRVGRRRPRVRRPSGCRRRLRARGRLLDDGRDRRDRTRAACAARDALMRGGLPAGTRWRGRGGCAAAPAPRRRGSPGSRAAAGSAGSGRCVSGGRDGRTGASRLAGSSGRSPGNTAASALPSNTLRAQPLARQRHADDAGQPLPARARLRLARGPQRGQRHHLDLGAGEGGARDRLVGDQAQDGLQPVVAGVVQMVGLGGGEQQAVDAAARGCRRARCWRRAGSSSAPPPWCAAGRPARAGPALTAESASIEHDLPVEAGEVVAEERLARRGPCSSRSGAPAWRRASRAGRRSSPAGGSGKKVSSGEPARSPGSRKRPGPGAVSSGSGVRAACR